MKLMRYSLVLIGLLFFIANGAFTELRSQERSDSIAVPFTLAGMNGEQHSLQSLRGSKLTVIVFWATWAKDAMPLLRDLEEQYRKYRKSGLMVIAINVERQQIDSSLHAQITDTVRAHQLSFPVLIDEELRTFGRYSVVAVPTTILADSNMRIIFRLSGYPIVGREELFRMIAERIEGKKKVEVKRQRGHQPMSVALRRYNLARREYARGSLFNARAQARKSLARDSLFAKPLLLLAEIDINEGNLAGAVAWIDSAARLDSSLQDVQVMRGFYLIKSNDLKGALAILNSEVERDTTDALAHCFLGYALGLSGDTSRSLQEFRRAETLSAREFRVPFLRSAIYEKMGRHNDARRDSLKAKELRLLL